MFNIGYILVFTLYILLGIGLSLLTDTWKQKALGVFIWETKQQQPRIFLLCGSSANRNHRMNSEMYGAMLSAQAEWLDNGHMHITKATKSFSKQRNGIFYYEFCCLQPNRTCFSVMEAKTEGRVTLKQATSEAGYSTGLLKHLKGQNSIWGCGWIEVCWQSLTAKDFYPHLRVGGCGCVSLYIYLCLSLCGLTCVCVTVRYKEWRVQISVNQTFWNIWLLLSHFKCSDKHRSLFTSQLSKMPCVKLSFKLS